MESKLTNRHLTTFNKSDQVVEGWYWALRSSELKTGQAKPARVMGKDLALFRGEDGDVVALDAHCPHRGSHLGLGKVEGNSVRCGYHRWKYDADGACVDAPLTNRPPPVCVPSWPVEEHYGLIWVWTGKEAKHPLPEAPELMGYEVAVAFGPPYEKGCHPNVVMCDAIDSMHFKSVHKIPGDVLDMEVVTVNEACQRFDNVAPLPKDSLLRRVVGWFYNGPLTFSLCYWFGHTGTVTIGPDFLHFHIMFTNRVGDDGQSEGQTVVLTRKRKGPIGWVLNNVILFLTWVVGSYFGMGDTPQFDTIKFDFKTPVKGDYTLVSFIQHVEQMPTAAWGYGAATDQESAAEPPRLALAQIGGVGGSGS